MARNMIDFRQLNKNGSDRENEFVCRVDVRVWISNVCFCTKGKTPPWWRTMPFQFSFVLIFLFAIEKATSQRLMCADAHFISLRLSERAFFRFIFALPSTHTHRQRVCLYVLVQIKIWLSHTQPLFSIRAIPHFISFHTLLPLALQQFAIQANCKSVHRNKKFARERERASERNIRSLMVVPNCLVYASVADTTRGENNSLRERKNKREDGVDESWMRNKKKS